MASVRSKDTEPELLLRRELHRRGLRYRLHTALPGKPDIVFPGPKVVVFVDGDFWHGHGWRERGFDSMEAQFTNHSDPAKWRAKIARNMARDIEVGEQLHALGWRVERVLESAVRGDVMLVADAIQRLITDR